MVKGKKAYFTEAEDREIIETVREVGIKECVKILSIKFGRERRAIKERYTNTLNPALNPDFSEEEDIHLIAAVKNYGTKWRDIEKIFTNKSQSQLKSRYLTLLRLMKRGKVSVDGHRLGSYRDRKYNIRRAKDESVDLGADIEPCFDISTFEKVMDDVDSTEKGARQYAFEGEFNAQSFEFFYDL